jgi:cytochrome c2
MSHNGLGAAALALVVGVLAAAAPREAHAQGAPIPQTPGWELVMRCVICHSVEVAVQQRFGPKGWSDTLDRMIGYGAPIPPEEREKLMAYLLRHFRDPDGR